MDRRTRERCQVRIYMAAIIGGLRLPTDAERPLAFNLGTRNYFVVLPFALALPAGWEMTVVVIVFLSRVELFGTVRYPWGLPRHLCQPDISHSNTAE